MDVELKKFGPPSFSGAPSKYFLVSKNFTVKCKGWEGGGADGATFFWEKRSKNYFCNNGGFKILFRPFSTSISEHVAQFQHSGGPSGKVGPPFKLTFLA